MEKLNVEQVSKMILYVADKVIESKPLLTEVDSKIGDGDHGIGMSIGFTKVKDNFQKKEFKNVNEVFQTTGMSMIASMGGASGVIFGTMFLGKVTGMATMEELDLNNLSKILDSALVAIKERGKASVGDKTMVDALEPAVVTLKEAAENSLSLLEALKKAEESAKTGVENTKKYVAKFGRAKSLLERAIGFQDAGATSVSIIFSGMREWVEQNNI
ncbi:MAG: dihydroxyacetone kinase subunit DhaL [Ruminiclostridium sp.]